MSNVAELKRSKTTIANFNLVGNPVINDYTYNMDRTSQKSDWIWNTLNLGIACGDCGTIYADMNSGYGENRDNVVYVHGKTKDEKGNEKDDFTNRYTIAWEDRFKESILKDIGDFCFVKIGLEQDVNGKTVEKRFLTQYDAIKYIQEHLTEEMVVNVRGNLRYREYEGSTQIDKEINTMFLSKAKPEEFRATFSQTILCDYNFLGKLDKEANTYGLGAYVTGYVGKHNGKQVKRTFAYNMPYEFELLKDDEDGEKTKRVINKYLKPKKKNELCEVNVEGRITKNGTSIDIVSDDIPQEIQDLIDLGLYTAEDIMKKGTNGGGKKETFLIQRPVVRVTKNDDGTSKTVIQFNKSAWDIDSLVFFSSLDMDENEAEETVDKAPKAEEDDEDDLSDLDLDDLFS